MVYRTANDIVQLIEGEPAVPEQRSLTLKKLMASPPNAAAEQV
jgi:hypothetical protein